MKNLSNIQLKWLLAASVPAILAGSHLTASAQSGNEERVEDVIIVTAQKRAQDIQDVPLSVTAITGDTLEASGIADLSELGAYTGNFRMDTANTARNTAIQIRGIGTSGTNPGIEASVGVYVDGVYRPTPGQSLSELVDIQNVEILRGPQGTLYGRNTPIGAVNVTTRKPSQEFEGMVNVGVGNYQSNRVSGYVGGGLSETLSARASFFTKNREGYEDNLFTGDDQNDSESYGGRIRALWTPTSDLEVNLILNYEDTKRRCCVAEQIDPLGENGIATEGFLEASAALGTPFRNFRDDDRVVDADDVGDDETEAWGTALTIDWTTAGDHILTSITSFDRWDNAVSISADALPQDVFQSPQSQVNEVWSQELRLTSPSDQRFEYLGGLYFYLQDTTFNQFNIIGPGANREIPANPVCPEPCMLAPGDAGGTLFEQETFSVAAFFDATLYITDAWSVSGGLRVSQDEKENFIDHFNEEGNSPAFDFVFQPPNFIGDVSRDDSNV